jgi:hypothetical protein
MLPSKIPNRSNRLTSDVTVLGSGRVAIVEMARVTSRTTEQQQEPISFETGAAYCQIVRLPL